MLNVYCWPGGKYEGCKCNCGAKHVNEKLSKIEITEGKYKNLRA
jgi:hypothetical protein